ncbi:hypothetical protein AWN76_000225 [Rhodothermaceae bacterium RA]|nr:hypothetical protein AWN76_000225 [Rhodothermaceae bacterium RA]
MTITGTVVYNDFEGGFWGIVADDGQALRPLDGLPEAVRKEGCRVETEVEPVQVLSFAMWGTPVKIHAIRPAEPGTGAGESKA